MLGKTSYNPYLLQNQGSATLVVPLPSGFSLTVAQRQIFVFRDGRKLVQGIDYTTPTVVSGNLQIVLDLAPTTAETFEVSFYDA